jgi:hypothetical protein
MTPGLIIQHSRLTACLPLQSYNFDDSVDDEFIYFDSG